MLLVGIISTSMITLTFSNRFLEQQDDLKERLLRNVESGLQLLMAEQDASVKPFVVDLFDEGLDSVILEKKEWGLFSIAISTAFHQTTRVSKKKIKYLLNQFNQGSNQRMEDSISQSFHQETLIIKDDVLIIEDQLLKGNIILTADSLVYIGRDAILEDVLIFAPYIFIEDGFHGNLQAFATHLLDIGKSVQLKYPSVLGLIKNENLVKEPEVIVGANSDITGLVFVHNKFSNKKYPKLKIQKGAFIEGQVFAECSVDLAGNIYGNISCKSFFLRYGSSSYSNNLLDVEINASKRSKAYLSPFLIDHKYSKVGVVKYLK